MLIGTKQNTKFTVMSDIRNKLLEDPEIRSIIANRIFPVTCPEEIPNGAFIVYSRDSYGIDTTKQGIYQERCNVFISCVSSDYDEASMLAEKVFMCIHGYWNYKNNETGVIINQVNLNDSTEDYANDKYIVTLSFEIL